MITSNLKTIITQDSANIPFTPSGDIQATNVQSAIAELGSEKADISHTHDYSTVTNKPMNPIISAIIFGGG